MAQLLVGDGRRVRREQVLAALRHPRVRSHVADAQTSLDVDVQKALNQIATVCTKKEVGLICSY